jgi:hypothetical protein
MKPINYIPSPSSPPVTLSPPTSPSHCTYFIVLSFIINSTLNHLILITTLYDRYDYYHQFTEENTEALRGYILAKITKLIK